MTERSYAEICRRLAARYSDLAEQSAHVGFRASFERLAASYNAIASHIEAAEQAATSEPKGASERP